MSYEDKVAAKRARYQERADKARAEATAARQERDRIMAAIPPGQPVLVGHHSEKRHRKDLARIDRAMEKGIDAANKAARLQHKAETYGTHGISSDDPDAIDKLREKLEALEARRAEAKPINAAVRRAVKAAEKRGEKPDHTAIIEALDAPERAKTALRSAARAFPWTPQLDLKNLGAEIRRLKARIAELEAAAVRPEADDIESEGFTIEEDKTENRVRFYFDTRPDKETCQKMRRAGFVFSRRAGAWQRKLNAAGIHAAHRMAKELFGWEGA